jgi:colicin import membrane protein
MDGELNNPTISLRERSTSAVGTGDRLSRWLLYSLIFHVLLLAGLILSPYFPTHSSRPAPPVYTVDLVGGEKIGGTRVGTELSPKTQAKEAQKPVTTEPVKPVETRKETKIPKEKIEKTEKIVKPEKAIEKPVKPVEKSPPNIEKSAPKETAKKELAKNESTKETERDAAPEGASLEKVRERLIQSAVDRAKSRAEAPRPSKTGDVLSVGPGEGDGAQALGQGGRGGGNVIKGADFLIYQGKIVSMIRENWAWPGQKGQLKALVRFGIKENGEIVGMKISEPSGDQAFDESILRALRKSSPLPAPPENYRKDFSQVEMNFQP